MVTGDGTNVVGLTVASTGRNYVVGNALTITAASLIAAGFTSAAGDLIITLTSPHINFNTSNEFTDQTPSNLGKYNWGNVQPTILICKSNSAR